MKDRVLTSEEKVFYAALARGKATEDEYITMWHALLATDVDPAETKNVVGSTPAHIAVYSNRPKLLAAVIEGGVDLNAQDGKGLTALHRAIDRGSHISIVKMLLDGGASVNSQDHNKETPLDYAMRKYSADSPILGILMDVEAKQRTDGILEPFSGSSPIVDDHLLQSPENLSYPGLRGAEDLHLPQPNRSAHEIPRLGQTSNQSLFGSMGRGSGLIGLGFLGLVATRVTKFIRNKLAAKSEKQAPIQEASTITSQKEQPEASSPGAKEDLERGETPIASRKTVILTPQDHPTKSALGSETPIERYIPPMRSLGLVTPESNYIGGEMDMSGNYEDPLTPVIEKEKMDRGTKRSRDQDAEPLTQDVDREKIPKKVRDEVDNLMINTAGVDGTVNGRRVLRKRKAGAVKHTKKSTDFGKVRKTKRGKGR